MEIKRRKLSKAESLRQAQVALLQGKSDAGPFVIRADSSPIKIVVITTPEEKRAEMSETRSDIIYLDGRAAPVFVKDDTKPFAHPFFWSPFVLFGNYK